MSRKRSIASILDDEEYDSSQSSTAASYRRNRSIASLIDEEIPSTSRTSSRNVITRQYSQSSILDVFHQLEIQEETGESSTSASARRIIEHKSEDDEYHENSDSTFVSRRRVNRYKNRPKYNINPPDDNSDEPSKSSEYTTEEDNISGGSSSRNESDDRESGDDEDSETFENYAPPNYEPFQDPPDLESTIDN